MRKKPNLLTRLEKCSSVGVKNPELRQGKWLKHSPFEELHIEIGCGKGRFTAETASSLPHTLLVAVERVPEAMVVAMERVTAAELRNVLFIDRDAALLPQYFEPGEVSVIYINFCDPWPKKRDAKRRLTAPSFLSVYSVLLKPGGEIRFKTDNLPLFEFSVQTFIEAGYSLSQVTRDLHALGISGVMTDYEAKFHENGIKINRLVAIKPENPGGLV